jgi:hypothetical protein
MIGDSRYGCPANRKTIARVDVEARVAKGLKHKRMAPDLIAEFKVELRREVQKDRLQPISTRDEVEHRLNRLSLTLQHLRRLGPVPVRQALSTSKT